MKLLSILDSWQRNFIIWILIVFTFLVFPIEAIYKDPPSYFNSFYCNLGTKVMADAGDYDCVSPQVIARADRLSLSVVEYNKAPGMYINFKAQVMTGPGSSLTSVTIKLTFLSSYTMKFGYMIITVGYTADNQWLDMITVKWPLNPADSSVTFDVISTTYQYTDTNIPLSLPTTFLSGVSHVLMFKSSFGFSISTTGYVMLRHTHELDLSNSTNVIIRVQTIPDVTVMSLYWGAILIKDSSKPTNIIFSGNWNGDYVAVNHAANYNFYNNYKIYGPSFNRKCIIGDRQSHYYIYSQNTFQISLTNSTLNNFFIVNVNSPNFTTQNWIHILCIANISSGQVFGNFDYQDNMTGNIYQTGTLCPVPITTFNQAPNYCPNCVQIQCITCNVTNRSQCTLCNSTVLTQLDSATGTCICNNWTIKPTSTDPCQPCLQNCQTCVVANCPLCVTAYGITASGTCSPCSSLFTVECLQCVSLTGGCTKCVSGFGVDVSGNCAGCSTLFNDCNSCLSQAGGCTVCDLTFGVNGAGQCDPCYMLFTNCVSCVTQAGGCTQCNSLYGVNSTGYCQQCSTLFTNCILCNSYNTGCSSCDVGFGVDSLNFCLSCSTLYSNCLLCVSYNTGCTKCSDGFGVNSVGQCQVCSTLYSNCLTCVSFNTGCTKCSDGFGLDSNGHCQGCAALKNCQLCESFTSGCTKCQAISNVYLLSNAICKQCSQVDPNCISCQPNALNSDLVCTQCSAGHILNVTLNKCVSCGSAIYDCKECFLSTVSSKVQCTLCTQKFVVDIAFGCEKCAIGLYYLRQCFHVPGCSSISQVFGRLTCLACSQSNFEFNSKTGNCSCQRGFYFHSIEETCPPKCGDGIKVIFEDCDDGNIFDGDGCSSSCVKQPGFNCFQNNADKTTCIFSQNIIITLDYIMKVDGENKAQLFFKVEPAPRALDAINWKKTMNFTFDEKIRPPLVSFSYFNGVLIATLSYYENIQGSICQADVTFNSSIVDSGPLYLRIQLVASNEKLSYQEQNLGQSQNAIKVAGFAVGIVALCCFIGSAYFHKLIGLETIQFIQLIYFVRIIFSNDSQSNVLAFNSLKYSNGYSEIHLSSQIPSANPSDIPSMLLNIQIHIYFLENCNLMLIPILLATLAYALYLYLSSKAQAQYKKSKDILCKDKCISLKRNVAWIYNNFIFSYCLALLYLTVFQMLVYELSNLSNQPDSNSVYVNFSFGLSLIVMFYIFAIFSSETLNGFKSYFEALNSKPNNHLNANKSLNEDQSKDYHPLYVPFYLLYQFFIIILINSSLLKFEYLTQVLIGVIFTYTVIFVYWKPYTLRIQNTGNIYNQVVLILFLGFEVLGKHNLMNEIGKMISIYAVIVLIIVALLLQLMRVYVYKNSTRNTFKIVREEDTRPVQDRVNALIANNPYVMENQLIKNVAEGRVHTTNLNRKPIEKQSIEDRQVLRKRFREQEAVKKHSQQIRKNIEPQVKEADPKETLLKIKQKLKKATSKPHEEWIFNDNFL